MPVAIHDLPLFLAAALVLNLTPGPDMLYVAGSAASRGTRAGLSAAGGVFAGCLLHVALAALGISALIAASPTAYAALKWAGAAYLVWAGIALLRRRDATTPDGGTPAAPPGAALAATAMTGERRVFWQGALINALNPKVALFFLALLPQFIDAGAPGQVAAFVALGLLFNAGGLLVNLAVAWGVGSLQRRVDGAGRWRRRLERLAGGLFIALGLRLALGSR